MAMKESSDFNGNEGIFRFHWQRRNLQISLAMKESSLISLVNYKLCQRFCDPDSGNFAWVISTNPSKLTVKFLPVAMQNS
jgi:hypothetical protein